MSDGVYAPRKLFTVEQVNAMLPLVKAIVSDLAALARDVVDRRDRLTVLLGGRDQKGTDPYRAELAQIEDELVKENDRLNEYVDELRRLGAEPKDALQGLVDFPAIIDDRVVYLCWKLGEPRVEYWHELDAGFPGRQPLVQLAGAGKLAANSG